MLRSWSSVDRWHSLLLHFLLILVLPSTLSGREVSTSAVSDRSWSLTLRIDPGSRKRSNSPVTVPIDFDQLLKNQKDVQPVDTSTVQVFAKGKRTPHRIETFYGVSRIDLHFVLPDAATTEAVLYFKTSTNRVHQDSYSGPIGNGDLFVEEFGPREIAPSLFDAMADLDNDGDLDLFKGGVEPYVYCYENVDGRRFVAQGRLTSDGKLFKLPCSKANRSWVTVAFQDVDGDGDQDFIPSFGDGPDSGKFILYRNISTAKGSLRFERIGALQTASGIPLAGGKQAGGWFPSVAFVRNWDGSNRLDALVGSNHRCWLYRSSGTNKFGAPVFAEAIAVQSDGADIVLTNPRFDCADVDGDGDLDLFAATQPGPVHWFENVGGPSAPRFTAGKIVAWNEKFLIGDAHSGVHLVDFDQDGLIDILSGRFWERSDLVAQTRVHGGFFRKEGRANAPHFSRANGPYTEQFQICDAVRQNCVRASDWDEDGEVDLLAGDTDGYVWFFRNTGSNSIFARPSRVQAGGKGLDLSNRGGHARLDVCDWNNDNLKDLVVADGGGSVTLFLNKGRRAHPQLDGGHKLLADGKPIQIGSRASALVCDWNSDGRKDLLLADDKGYYICKNMAEDGAPRLAAPQGIRFGGKSVRYVRPNLGSFVDWDGDGRRDLVAAHFENSLRFYRNISAGAEPVFADPEGQTILSGESPQMISGVDVVDWNKDGDLDILTGQGHGGSGLRFYERDWLEEERGHPKIELGQLEAVTATSR